MPANYKKLSAETKRGYRIWKQDHDAYFALLQDVSTNALQELKLLIQQIFDAFLAMRARIMNIPDFREKFSAVIDIPSLEIAFRDTNTFAETRALFGFPPVIAFYFSAFIWHVFNIFKQIFTGHPLHWTFQPRANVCMRVVPQQARGRFQDGVAPGCGAGLPG